MITIVKKGETRSVMRRLGKIQDVLSGNVKRDSAGKTHNAADFAYGFELGTPKNIESLGESVLVNGYCYATSSDENSIEHNELICGPTFHAGGMFFIPHEARPTHQAVLDKGGGVLKCNDFYQSVYDTIKEPFAFVGILHLEALHGFAISKPPIYGKNIFENRSEYFRNPEIFDNHRFVFAIGVVANFKEVKEAKLKKELEHVLYRNPLDKDAALSYHSHALALKYQVGSYDEIKPNAADKCLHLLSDGTRIASGGIDIFTFKELREYT